MATGDTSNLTNDVIIVGNNWNVLVVANTVVYTPNKIAIQGDESSSSS